MLTAMRAASASASRTSAVTRGPRRSAAPSVSSSGRRVARSRVSVLRRLARALAFSRWGVSEQQARVDPRRRVVPGFEHRMVGELVEFLFRAACQMFVDLFEVGNGPTDLHGIVFSTGNWRPAAASIPRRGRRAGACAWGWPDRHACPATVASDPLIAARSAARRR